MAASSVFPAPDGWACPEIGCVDRPSGIPPGPFYVSAEIAADLELEAGFWALVLPPSAAMFGTTATAWYGLPVPRDEAFHVIVPAGDVVPRRARGLCRTRGWASTNGASSVGCV
jgi:hypothetical protein